MHPARASQQMTLLEPHVPAAREHEGDDVHEHQHDEGEGPAPAAALDLLRHDVAQPRHVPRLDGRDALLHGVARRLLERRDPLGQRLLDVRDDALLERDGGVWKVLNFQQTKTARQAAMVRTKLKNLVSGTTVEDTFRMSETFQTAQVDTNDAVYSYDDGDSLVFMDAVDFDEITIPRESIENIDLVKDGMTVQIVKWGDTIVDVQLPTSETYEVTYTEPGLKNAASTGQSKDATLETGAVIQVPLFVEIGDVVKVKCAEREFIEHGSRHSLADVEVMNLPEWPAEAQSAIGPRNPHHFGAASSHRHASALRNGTKISGNLNILALKTKGFVRGRAKVNHQPIQDVQCNLCSWTQFQAVEIHGRSHKNVVSFWAFNFQHLLIWKNSAHGCVEMGDLKRLQQFRLQGGSRPKQIGR